MHPDQTAKLKTLGLICLTTCFAGVLYQLIGERFLNYQSVAVGFPLGLAFGVMELYLFPKAEKRFRQWTFTRILVFKAILYTITIYIVTVLLMLAVGMSEGRQMREIPPVLLSTGQLVLVLYTLVLYGLLVFFLQINRLLGKGVLWKFISGKYHKPREEERIFMFLDMKSSTTIAERLGNERFYSLLNELFHEISQPVLQTKAEIYQYVGDQVVLTWEVNDGIENANCLKAFFLFRQRLLNHNDNYQKGFGVRPEFKAGLHYGKVISAQIGDLKREIVYNGDVLNTAARIQNACNTYDRDFLVSGMLIHRLRHLQGFECEKLETVTLRGKEKEVEIFSVTSVS